MSGKSYVYFLLVFYLDSKSRVDEYGLIELLISFALSEKKCKLLVIV